MRLDKIPVTLQDQLLTEMSCSFSPGIITLPGETLAAILVAIAAHRNCDSGSSQFCENDSGVLQVNEITVCWRIDYDDRVSEKHSADPSSGDAGKRVLNIYRADEH